MKLLKKSLVAPSLALFLGVNLFAQESYTIESKTLKEALEIISKKSKLFYVAKESLIEGKKAPNIQNVEGLENTLKQLLKNTKLEAIINNDTIIIKKKKVQNNSSSSSNLGEIEISGYFNTEDTDSWTGDWLRSATGLNLSQKETPQSVSMITNTLIKDLNLISVQDIMARTTGITSSPYDSERDNYFARGFEIDNYQYDGVPIARPASGYNFGADNNSMVLYDHIELIRGANGLMHGSGNPGASINYVRKKPTKDFRGEVALGGSLPKGIRIEGDISGSLNESGTLRGRLIAAHEDKDTNVDRYNKKKDTFAGILEYDFNDQTRVNFGANYQDTKATNVSWGGLYPYDSNGDIIDWDKDTNWASDWTYTNTQRTETYATLEHVFDNNWTATVTGSHFKSEAQMSLLWATCYGCSIDANTGGGMDYSASKYENNMKQNSFNITLNGDFDASSRNHEFILGAMYSKADSNNPGFLGQYNTGNPNVIEDTYYLIDNIFNWDGSTAEPDYYKARNTNSTKTTQMGIYGTLLYNVSDAVNIISGLRINNWDGKIENSSYPPVYEYEYKAELIPYIGVTYNINENYTAYTSATSIYKPQLFRDEDRNYLDPAYGYNYEMGLKADLFDSRLFLSTAIYRTEQKDVAEYSYYDEEEDLSVYESIDGTSTKGFEIEGTGKVTDEWNIMAGYTYKNSKDNEGNKIYLNAPAHTVKVFSDYQVPSFNNKLKIGGGIRWQSKIKSADSSSPTSGLEQKSYTLYDLNTKYNLNEDTSITLSVDNVLDEKYYSNIGFYDKVSYGLGRSAQITLRMNF